LSSDKGDEFAKDRSRSVSKPIDVLRDYAASGALMARDAVAEYVQAYDAKKARRKSGVKNLISIIISAIISWLAGRVA
jgi:hypothetical protein